jgi:hypothetical protein
MSVAFERGRDTASCRSGVRLFGGLDLIEPGLAPVAHWRPGTPAPDDPVLALACVGVGVKP